MNGVLKIHNNLSENAYFDMYKKALIDHQSFRLGQTKYNDSIVQNITQKLGNSQTQYEGLTILHCLLNQCTLDVIEQKGNNWISICIKICKGKHSVASLAYDVIGILVRKSRDISELGKSFSSNYIAKICETFNKVESSTYLSALKCLLLCLKFYPGSCGGNSYNFIEKFLIKNFIDSTDLNLVKRSGTCFHLLQQVRGGGVQGVSHKVSWKNYQTKLIGSLHGILDLLFAHCPEFYVTETEKECLILNSINLDNDPVIRTGQLSTRFNNLINYLIIAIREPFPVSKALQPKKILDLITRGLAITCEILQRNEILDNIAVGAILPEIHIQLYKLLETLILTLKNHLNIFHEQILGLFIDTLKWTSSGKSVGFQKPYRDLRFTTYSTLSIWCQTMKFSSCVELVFDNIFNQIDNDITPFRNEIMLQVLNGARKHLSKKARRQLHKVQNEKSHLGQTHMKSLDAQNSKVVYSDDGNKKICVAGLTALKDILNCSSCFLKPLTIKEVQEKVIKISLSLNEFKNLKTTLYSNSICREKMYDVLSFLVIASHDLCPPPTQLIIELLTEGQINDYNRSVRKCCTQHLCYIEKILHPQKQSLYFPPDLISIKCALNSRKTNSESESSDKDDSNDVIISSDTDADELNDKIQTKISSAQNNITMFNDEINDPIQKSDHINEDKEQFEKHSAKKCDNLFIENTVCFAESNLLQNNENINKTVCVHLENNNVETNIEDIEESIENIFDENQQGISCPKKRLLHNLQKISEDEDVVNSPKRTKIESTIPENHEHEKSFKNSETPEENFKENDENAFEEILATFTDEVNDE